MAFKKSSNFTKQQHQQEQTQQKYHIRNHSTDDHNNSDKNRNAKESKPKGKLLQKYLRNADNLKRAHAVMRETFMDLLSDKVERDREEIQERTDKWEEKMRQMEANRVS